MGMPKSVVKIKKDGIEYVSSVNKIEYTMLELERAALRDSGKLLKKRTKAKIPKVTGNTRKTVATWVRKPWKNRAAHLQIGVYNFKTAAKKHLEYSGYYFHILEFGSRLVKALRPLTSTAKESIQDVRKIQAQYLSYVDNEQKALSVINEDEEVDDS
jgi:hypothetical protein